VHGEPRLVVPPLSEIVRDETKLTCGVEELEAENLPDLARPLDEEDAGCARRLAGGNVTEIGEIGGQILAPAVGCGFGIPADHQIDGFIDDPIGSAGQQPADDQDGRRKSDMSVEPEPTHEL
jgi:hypothetical protein